jgi:hypothetical protein
MSSNIKNIYEDHIKPLPREQRVQLLNILRDELENSDDNGKSYSILELHGLGKEIWQDVNARDYLNKLRDEWEERA